MQAVIPADLLANIRIMPIPRGGLLVAGWLAYALNIGHNQFFDDGISPICIVDDCSLTGKRFGQMISRFNGREVWFCHLASTSELRQAILKKEPSVQGCIAADDLFIEHSKVAEQIAAEDRYLNMSVGPVIFPWTEPGLPITVPFSNEVQDGWRLMPPHMVLGNLALLKLPSKVKAGSIDIQSTQHIVWRLIENGILLYEGRDQKLFELSGLAADVWKGCAGYQNREMATRWSRSMQKSVSVKEASLLIDKLVANKLLVQI